MADNKVNPSGLLSGCSDTRLFTLDNGLAVIVREDHSAPVASVQAWAKTGSIHEGQWLGAGLSHILEHMLFKGTETRGVGRIDQEVQEAGGYMNAYTSFDRTVYHIDVPNTGAKTAIDILCDIMQHATLPEDELTKELDVIRREIDMGQDDPGRRSSRRLFEVAYTSSPYRHSIIGYPDIFNELSRNDIVGYYRARYIPNNMFYVIVGDVEADAVIAQIEEAFSKNKSKPLPSQIKPEEPRQTAPRRVVEEASIQLGHLHFSWHVPDVRHADLPALDVAATLLGNGRSSRLYQNVREKKGLVNSADAWTYTPTGTGLFGMSAVLNADKLENACAAMLNELAVLREELVPNTEINKVMKQFVSATLGTRRTMEGQAQTIGDSWISVDDLEFSDRYLEQVKQVDSDDVQRVTSKYMVDSNNTLYALMPRGSLPKATMVDVQNEPNEIAKYELPNGLCLLTKEDHRLPFVHARMFFQGGVLAETKEINGVNTLMSKLLVKGTTSRTGQQIADQIESVGGYIDAAGGNNSFSVNMEVMSDDLALGLDMLADVVLNPSFPGEAFERQREVQLAALKAQDDRLLTAAFKTMRETLYGRSGYGLDGLGTESSVKSLSADVIATFHRQLAVPNNAVLAIYGDIKTEFIRSEIEKALALWGQGVGFEKPVTPSQGDGMQRVSRELEKEQAVVVVGYRGCTFYDEDRFALELISEACSDLGSRLFMRIREELGLAYYVGAQCQPGLLPGTFTFYAGTAPNEVTRVEQELLDQVAKLRDEGLTEKELRRSKNKVIGQKKIARQDLGGLASMTALDELYGLGYDSSVHDDSAIEAITGEQIQAAAQRCFQPGNCVVSIIQPPA